MASIKIVHGGVCKALSNGKKGVLENGTICGHKHIEHKDSKKEFQGKGCKKCGCNAIGIY